MPTLTESAFFVDIKICTIFAVREPAKPLNNAKIGGSFFSSLLYHVLTQPHPYFYSSNAQISSRIASICRDARLVRPKTQLNKIITTGDQTMLAILIFIALVVEILKYLTGGKSKDFFFGGVMFYRR